MIQKIQKWGNSLAVRIPKNLAEELHLQTNSEIEMVLEDRALVIRTISQPQYDLDELLAGVTSDNIHGEVDWGSPVGNEVW